MKRTIFGLLTILVVFVAVFAVLVLHPVRTVKGHHGCSDRTLSGNYGLVATAGLGKGVNWSFSMLATFDGRGGFTGSSFDIVFNGTLSGPYTFTGASYDVNSDCTYTLTIPAELPFSGAQTFDGIVVDTGGDEGAGTWYDSTDYISGTFDIKKVPDLD